MAASRIELGTIEDVRRILNLGSRQATYRAVQELDMPGVVRLGQSRLRFRLDEIEDWVRQGCPRADSATSGR